jgi:hypothetical protein
MFHGDAFKFAEIVARGAGNRLLIEFANRSFAVSLNTEARCEMKYPTLSASIGIGVSV